MANSANRSGSSRRLLRALLCVAPALCAGCGSSFEEGDEAWIRVPGEVLLLDEYIVVEVDRFTDRGVEVEVDRSGRDWRRRDWVKHTPYSLIRLIAPHKGVRELEDKGETDEFDADQLIDPDVAEDDYEATREIIDLVWSFLDESSSRKRLDWIAEADVEEIQAALEMAENLRLDEAELALRMLIETVEALSEVADEEVDEGSALELLDSYRKWVDEILDVAGDDDDRDRFKLLSKDEDDRRDRIFEQMDLAFMMVMTVFDIATDMAESLPPPVGGDSDLDDMIAHAGALLELHESRFLLVTMDGEEKFKGTRIKKLLSKQQDELAQKIGTDLVNSIGVQEAASLDDVEEAYEGLKESAKRFRDELDLKLLTPKTEIRLHERAANSFSERIELALEGSDFDGAAAAIRGYMDVQGALASLKAQHGNSNRQVHLDREREWLASRLDTKLREGALEVASVAARRGDNPTAVVERIKEWAKPFSEALGGEALDEEFLRDVREQGELVIRRGAVRAGQVWTGWIQCQEAASLRRYKDDEGGHRGPLYHGVDRMEAKLELIEAQGSDLAVMRLQGLLTAQNLPDGGKWRQWDPEAKSWTNSEKASSSQFVVLAYRPALMTAELGYGVLDRRKHVEKYGPSDHWVSQVDGAWQRFFGRGAIDLDEGSISGKMTRRYIDDTCGTFRFTLGEGASASLPRPEAGTESPSLPTAPPPGPGTSSGPAPSEGETQATEGPPPGLTSETYIGGVKSRGLQMHGLSANGDWCAEKVVFKISAESGDVFTDGTAKFFVKRFGEQINQPQYCPFAQTADIYGYAGGNQLVFRGTASASDGWTVR